MAQKKKTYLYCFPEVFGVFLVFKRVCSNKHDIKSNTTGPYISHLKEEKTITNITDFHKVNVKSMTVSC